MGEISTPGAFLNAIRPGGPWLVVAIHPIDTFKGKDGNDYKKTQATWCEDASQVDQVCQRRGKYNLYYQINPTTGKLKKKAKSEQIAAVEFLQVDIDPPVNASIYPEQWRKHALEELQDHNPPPSVIVSSGNGLQALWKLDAPFPINGDGAKAAHMAGYNKALGNALDGDRVHDVARIFRLPFTTNHPDAKKQARGRVAMPASLVECNLDRAYDLAQFEHKPAERVAAAGLDGDAEDGPPLHVSALSDYAEGIAPEIIDLINHGAPVGRRSEAVARVCCALYKAGVPDRLIIGIMKAPGNGISDKPLEKWRWFMRDLARHKGFIQSKAKEAKKRSDAFESFADGVEFLNKRYAYVIEGKAATWFRKDADRILETGRGKLAVYDDNSHLRYMDVEGKPRGLVKDWLKSGEFDRYDGFTFGVHDGAGRYFNLWRGFAVDPIECDELPASLRRLMLEALCDNDAGAFEFLLDWCAAVVQNPTQPIRIGTVLVGPQGVGKGTLGRLLMKLFGVSALTTTQIKHLAGDFNGQLQNAGFVFGDEITAASRDQYGALNALITEPMITIEKKALQAFQGKNACKVLLASNNDFAVRLVGGNRRWFIREVSDRLKSDRHFWADINHEIDHGDLPGRFLYLMQLRKVSLADLESRLPSVTQDRKQRDFSLPLVSQIMHSILDDAEFVQFLDGAAYVSAEEIVAVTKNRLSARFLAQHLRGMGAKQWRKWLTDTHGVTKQARLWKLPTRDEAQRKYAEAFATYTFEATDDSWANLQGNQDELKGNAPQKGPASGPCGRQSGNVAQLFSDCM